MRTPIRLALAPPLALLACAAPRAPGAGAVQASAAAPDAALARFSPEVRDAIRAHRVLRGMSREAVALAWGEPDAVERRPSVTAKGLVYERWKWIGGAAREAMLVDGRVIDAWSPPAP